MERKFFIKENSWKSKESFSIVELFQKRDKTQLETFQEQLTKETNHNLYDWYYFNSTILYSLRKNNYDTNWIEQSDLINVFTEFLSLQESQLIETANEWFINVYNDCEREASQNTQNEKSDEFSKSFKLTELLEQKLKIKLKPDKILNVWDYLNPTKLKDYKEIN